MAMGAHISHNPAQLMQPRVALPARQSDNSQVLSDSAALNAIKNATRALLLATENQAYSVAMQEISNLQLDIRLLKAQVEASATTRYVYHDLNASLIYFKVTKHCNHFDLSTI